MANSNVAREPIMEQTVEPTVSDWVTGIVFPRLSVSVKSGSNALSPVIHVMRRDDARLRKELDEAPRDAVRVNHRCNWHKGRGIKLAEILIAATRIGIRRR